MAFEAFWLLAPLGSFLGFPGASGVNSNIKKTFFIDGTDGTAPLARRPFGAGSPCPAEQRPSGEESPWSGFLAVEQPACGPPHGPSGPPIQAASSGGPWQGGGPSKPCLNHVQNQALRELR